MPTQYYWPDMVSNLYGTVESCESYAHIRQTRKEQWKLRLFPATEPLDHIVIGILCPLPKTKYSHQYIVMMTKRFSKLTKAIATARTTVTTMATISLEQVVRKFGLPTKFLTDNEQQSTINCFATIYTQLGVKVLKSSEYPHQAYGQVQCFNRTIDSRKLCGKSTKRFGRISAPSYLCIQRTSS